MAIAAAERDVETVRAGLARWLGAQHPERADLAVAPLGRPAAGLSSDTLFADVTWRDGSESLVVRLPPAGAGLFPRYDLEHQARVQQALARTAVPVAVPVRHERDEQWVGAPFLVMPRVPGRVLLANPSFLVSGWLHDAPPADQARLFDGFLATLADLHRVDWRADGLGFLARTEAEGLQAEVARWSEYLAWAANDVAPPGYLAEALAWCVAHRPVATSPAALLWGDVQLVNAVFADDLSVAAVLDWEMTGIGPPELDLGWFLALHGMTAAAHGRDLPGFPPRDAMVARYEEALGRAVGDLRWFEVFALVRSGSIMVRIARLLAAQGVDDSWLTRGNPTQDALARLLT